MIEQTICSHSGKLGSEVLIKLQNTFCTLGWKWHLKGTSPTFLSSSVIIRRCRSASAGILIEQPCWADRATYKRSQTQVPRACKSLHALSDPDLQLLSRRTWTCTRLRIPDLFIDSVPSCSNSNKSRSKIFTYKANSKPPEQRRMLWVLLTHLRPAALGPWEAQSWTAAPTSFSLEAQAQRQHLDSACRG